MGLFSSFVGSVSSHSASWSHLKGFIGTRLLQTHDVTRNVAMRYGGIQGKSSFIHLVRSGKRKPKKRKNWTPALEGNCFKKGVVTKVFVASPKKPNSANRKCCKVTLSNGKSVNCFIPGEGGHNLFEHSTVLVRGGRTQDLIGFKYKVVRGAYDLKGVVGRVTSRSKYGTKRPKKA